MESKCFGVGFAHELDLGQDGTGRPGRSPWAVDVTPSSPQQQKQCPAVCLLCRC